MYEATKQSPPAPTAAPAGDGRRRSRQVSSSTGSNVLRQINVGDSGAEAPNLFVDNFDDVRYKFYRNRDNRARATDPLGHSGALANRPLKEENVGAFSNVLL